MPVIGYIQIAQDPILDVAKASLFKALADSGFISGKNITILDNNAQGDLSMIPMILQSLVSRPVDVVVTNSTPCMVAAAQMVKEIPVVFTVAFEPKQVGLKSIPANLSGVYDSLKAGEFADILVKCIPGLKKVGMPYNTAEPNAVYSVKVIRAVLVARGIQVVTSPVNSPNDIMMAGQSLAQQEIGAFVVAADNTVYLGLNTLAAVADKASIPLFVTDPMHTRQGAVLGFGADYEKWGYASGLKVVDLLKHRNGIARKIMPLGQYSLIINKNAAGMQHLLIPKEISDRATQVIE